MQDPRKQSNLDDIKKKLYSTHYKPIHRRAKLSDKKYDLDNDWDPNNNNGEQSKKFENSSNSTSYWGPNATFSGPESTPKKSTNKIFTAILGVAALFFIGAAAYAYYVFVGFGTPAVSGDDVTINIAGPVSIGGGEPLALDVIVQNNNSVAMELVDLVVNYPAGTKDADDLVTDLRSTRIDLGDIEPGEVVRRTATAALFGEENSKQDVSVSIQYRLAGSNAIFEKNKPFEIVLSASPVRLVVDALRDISSGQEMEIRALLSSNSTKPLENVMVVAQYPFGFIFESANINPSTDNDTWLFETLNPEEEREIIITGTISGQNEEDRVFRFNTGIKEDGTTDNLGIVWSTITHETTIKRAFVDFSIAINNSFDPVVISQSGQRVNGILSFVNTTDDILRDIEIEIGLNGDVYDERTVRVENGFYDSIDNKIIWSPETSGIFGEIEPRENYRLSFSFDLLDYSRGDGLVSNPQLDMQALVKAIRVADESSEDEIFTDTFASVKIASDVPVNIYTLYNTGAFTDTGPVPPVAETETSYTIGFDIANNLNDLTGVKLEATLPSYVRWNDKYIPRNGRVSYDSATRRIVWNVGDVPARTGFGFSPEQMFLNISLIPSISQIGLNPDILRDIKITGYDEFAQKNFVQQLPNRNITIQNRSIADRHNTVTE